VDNELEVIRTEMEQTRSSLADKLEALESEFRGAVEGTTSAVANTVETVQETVENVKESVQETVTSVKETLNVRKHVERHPWAMFGGAVLVGCFAGSLLGRRSSRRRPETTNVEEGRKEAAHPVSNGNGRSRKAAAPEEEGTLQSVLKTIKGLALGTLMGALRDVLEKAAPASLTSDLANAVDDMTTKLGGTVLPRDAGGEPAASAAGSSTEQEEEEHHGNAGVAEVGRSVGTARWSR